MDLGLKGKVAVVTGASRGIGKGIAMGLAREGCNVVICARGEEALEQAAGEIEGEGVRALALALDITEKGAAETLVERTVEEFGGIDVIVGNVGGNRRKPFEETTDEDWEAILDLNLKSHIRTSRAAIPHLKESDNASICYISSIFGREVGGAGISIYNATKSALISMGKVMAQELTPDGIRVNIVAPGSIRFPGGSWDRRVREKPEEMKAFVSENLPIGRFGRAHEVADVVTFLASERASLVTGACLNVDGGQSRSLI